MRIGVDARSLSEPISGIGRYTLNLLELMVQDDSHEWILYSHRPLINGSWNRKNIKLSNWNLPKSFRVLRMLWAQSILPIMATIDKVDLFWSPAHRLPRFLPKSIVSVVTIHDLVWKFAPETMRPLSQKLDAKLMPEAIKNADWIIAVSKWTAKDLIDEVPNAKRKTSIIYEAPSLTYDSIIVKKSLNKNYLLFVGTLEPRKNLPRLLEAYSFLPSHIKEKYSLNIVGGRGWGKVNFESLIEHFKIKKYVKILGYLSDKDLAKTYQNASILVMPSLYEGFGLPLLEAMNAEVPVVTSNISSMPEIVGKAAILVDPYDVNSIKEGMIKVLTDLNLRSSLSKEGLKQSKNFSWKKAAEKTMLVFTEAISSQQGNNF